MRLDSDEGLSFIEFNYMLLQAYDFLELFNRHQLPASNGRQRSVGQHCRRHRIDSTDPTGDGFRYHLPADHHQRRCQNGKNRRRSRLARSRRTSPYEYYQYWINTDDRDVATISGPVYLSYPWSDSPRSGSILDGADLNSAKTVLAFEATASGPWSGRGHSSLRKSITNFGVREVPVTILPSSRIHADHLPMSDAIVGNERTAVGRRKPTTVLDARELRDGIPAFKLFQRVGLADFRRCGTSPDRTGRRLSERRSNRCL